MGIQGRSFCQHLCSGTCPVVGRGPGASGCPCLCMASVHLQNLGPTHHPWGEEEEEGEGPAGCTNEKPEISRKNHTRTACGLLFGVALLQQCWLWAVHPALGSPLLFGLFRILMSIGHRVTCTQILHAGFLKPVLCLKFHYRGSGNSVELCLPAILVWNNASVSNLCWHAWNSGRL